MLVRLLSFQSKGFFDAKQEACRFAVPFVQIVCFRDGSRFSPLVKVDHVAYRIRECCRQGTDAYSYFLKFISKKTGLGGW